MNGIAIIRAALEELPPERAAAVTHYSAMLYGVPREKSGTMKDWFQEHDGQTVETLQVKQDGRGLWAPGARRIDASTHAGSVNLSGSTRYYAGFRVLASDKLTLAVESDEEVIVYRLFVTSPVIDERFDE